MKNYTKEDIRRICKEEDVHYIRMQFTDIMGIVKNVEIPITRLEDALDNNVMFDGSSIEGFVRIYEADMTPEEKLAHINAQLQKEPNNPALVYKYAFELHTANRIAEAIPYYNQAIKLNAKNEDAYINLAQAYKQQQKYDKAREILTNAKALFPESSAIKKQLASIDTETSSLLYNDATELFKQKKYKKQLMCTTK